MHRGGWDPRCFCRGRRSGGLGGWAALTDHVVAFVEMRRTYILGERETKKAHQTVQTRAVAQFMHVWPVQDMRGWIESSGCFALVCQAQGGWVYRTDCASTPYSATVYVLTGGLSFSCAVTLKAERIALRSRFEEFMRQSNGVFFCMRLQNRADAAQNPSTPQILPMPASLREPLC